MFIYAALMIAAYASGGLFGEDFEQKKDTFVLCVMLFSAFSAVLEYCIRLIRKGILPTFLSILPGAIGAFFLRRQDDISYLAGAIILSMCIRLAIGIIPFWKKIVLYGSFVLTALAIFLNITRNTFTVSSGYELFMFVCLVSLTLCSFQQLFIEKGKTAFPFSYFFILSVLLTVIPVNDDPIDWTGVIRAGQKIVQGADYALSSVSYFFTDVLDIKTNSTGYSTLTNLGGNAKKTKTTELIIHAKEKPYVLFNDPDSGEKMKRRRGLYLTGGRGLDKEVIVDFLLMLHEGSVSRETAKLFSHISDVNLEYVYLRTRDEIVPAYSFKLSSNGKKIEKGQSKNVHKKGYEIRSRYLDIDFGSQYLIALLKDVSANGHMENVGYEELSNYVRDIYGVGLNDIVSEDEYNEILEKSARFREYRQNFPDNGQKAFGGGEYSQDVIDSLDVSGADEELRSLAYELTKDYDNDYDKCRAIEAYLRQYEYSLLVPEEGDLKVDMTTAEGMSRLAESFLFETQKGYCIHYTSAMVMMLRLSGIPARVALGYCYLYPFEEEEFYPVEGDRAHVWPEAYISNVGWTGFEPTGSYPTAENLTWNRAPMNAGKSGEASYYMGPSVKKNTEGNPDEDGLEPQNQDAREKASDPYLRVLYLTVSLMLPGAGLIILLILFTVVAHKLRYTLGTPDEKLSIRVEQIKKMIRKYSRERIPDRGFLSEYLKRAPVQLQPDIEKIFCAYYALLYSRAGKASVSMEDVERAGQVMQRWKKGDFND